MKMSNQKILREIQALRKQQIAEIDKLTIPLKENLKLIDLTLKGHYNLKAFINSTEQVNKYILRLKKCK